MEQIHPAVAYPKAFNADYELALKSRTRPRWLGAIVAGREREWFAQEFARINTDKKNHQLENESTKAQLENELYDQGMPLTPGKMASF